MVFAPAPQLTITIEQRGEEPDIHLHAGGQGVWQARMITALGVRVALCTTLGGETGRVLAGLIGEEGVEVHAVRGESRNGAYVHDRRAGTRVDIADAPADPLSRHEHDELYGLALAEGMRADVSLLGGPSPEAVVAPETYRRLATDLGRNGRTVVADLSGDHLVAVLRGGPRFIKVSHEELFAGGWAEDEAGLVGALFALRDAGAESIMVSRAEKPALALLDDAAYEVTMPELEPADPRGAGDSMTAGVAAALAQGADLMTAVRTGVAAGALNVTRHGLGTGRSEGVDAIAEHVELVAVTSPAGLASRRLTSPEDLARRARPQ